MKAEKYLAWKKFVAENEYGPVNRLLSVQNPYEVESPIGELLFDNEHEAILNVAIRGCLKEAIQDNWILCEVEYRPVKSAAELMTKEALMKYEAEMMDDDLELLD